MKRFLMTLLSLSMVGAVFTGCKDKAPSADDSDGSADQIIDKVALLTFGFAEKDNPDIISEDIAGKTKETDVLVIMSDDIDKTALAPYFTVPEGATVTVEGVPQESGVTVQNFMAPVDYIVSNESKNKKYTVYIAKNSDFAWSQLSVFNGVDPNSFMMKVNPVTGEPYLLMRVFTSATEGADSVYRAVMARYSEGTWSYVGSNRGFSTGEIAGYYDMTFDDNGNPYVVYADNAATVKGAATVQYFDGSQWSIVGNEGITSAQVNYSGIALKNDGNPMLLTYYNKAAGDIAKRDIAVSTYSGASWTTDQTIPGRASGTYGYYPTGKLVNGTTYWAVHNQNNGTYSVYAYKNGWTTVADNVKEETATHIYLKSPICMDLDSWENIYMGICDDADVADTYKPRIRKYAKSTGKWSTVGVIDVVNTGTKYFNMALSPLNIPFVIYSDAANGAATVVYVDSNTKTWSEPVPLSGTAKAKEVFIGFDPNTGVGYAAYELDLDGSIILYKYESVL